MSSHREEISAVLLQKLQAYDEFQSVTGDILTALEGGAAAEVNRGVERREALMRDIEGLDRRIARCRRAAPPEQAPAIDRLLTEMSGRLGAKLERIVAASGRCAALAARQHEALRTELAAVRQKKAGFHGYAVRSPRTPKFLNVQT